MRDNKQIPSDTLIELAEIVLNKKFLKKLRKILNRPVDPHIETRIVPPYAILFITDLEEKILNIFVGKHMIWWRYIDDIFLFGNMEKDLWKNYPYLT